MRLETLYLYLYLGGFCFSFIVFLERMIERLTFSLLSFSFCFLSISGIYLSFISDKYIMNFFVSFYSTLTILILVGFTSAIKTLYQYFSFNDVQSISIFSFFPSSNSL